MKPITPADLQQLRAQLAARHAEELAAIDRVIAIFAPGSAPVSGAESGVSPDSVPRLTRPSKPARRALKAPSTGSTRAARRGWLQQIILDFCAQQKFPFTTPQVRDHCRTQGDLSQVQLYSIPVKLLNLCDQGILAREGTGRSAQWTRVGQWDAPPAQPSRAVADRYNEFRAQIKTPTQEEP